MQDNRPNILFTRQTEDEVLQLSAAKGLDAHFLPFIRTEIIDTEENRKKLADLAKRIRVRAAHKAVTDETNVEGFHLEVASSG